jgi:hypothetical protein
VRLLTLRDLFEAVERIQGEQAAQGGGLHHIADTVDRIEKLVRDGCGTPSDGGEGPPPALGGDCAS